MNQLTLAEGRFIQPLDCERATPVAVLGASVADQLFPLDECLGQSIRIGNDRYYRVVGVIEPRASTQGSGSGVPTQNYAVDVYIPFDTDQRRFGENVSFDPNGSQPPEKVEISQLTIGLNSTRQVHPAAELVRSILLQNGRGKETVVTVPLDLIVTPSEVIESSGAFSPPGGIRWEALGEEKVAAIPLLERLRGEAG